MSIRIVKRWHEKAMRFVFWIQQWEDDSSFSDADWVDRCGPYDTHMDARQVVTDVILNNKSIHGTDLVVEVF